MPPVHFKFAMIRYKYIIINRFVIAKNEEIQFAFE
jgi:hypothetical protein